MRLMEELAAAGHRMVRSLASVMTEALEPNALTLGDQIESYDRILAKTVLLDEWPDVIDKAPWTRGATLRLFVDHEDKSGFHLMADLCTASGAALPQVDSRAVGIMVHGSGNERATAELRPNFPTRVLSPAIQAPLDELALTIVAA
jgi:hypothetical protein